MVKAQGLMSMLQAVMGKGKTVKKDWGGKGSSTTEIIAPLLDDSYPARSFRNAPWIIMAVSGWLVVAGVTCAYFVQINRQAEHLHTQHLDSSASSAPRESGIGLTPVVLAEKSDGGLKCDWLLLVLIRAAGCGQILLVVASAAIPFLLDYKKELAAIEKPLLKDMFLVYSGYILTINLLFGLLSAFAAESLLEVGFLPSVVTGFIFFYWFARLLVELFVFDLSFLNRPHEIVGRRGIEILFTLLPLIYGVAFAHNLGKLSLHYAVPDIGPFGRMLVIIIVLFEVMKILVLSMPKSEGPKLTRFQTLLFLFVWPGMQPANLLGRKKGLDWWRDAGWGTLFIVLGFLWAVAIKLIIAHGGVSDELAGLLCLPAISMMGHVGGMRILRGGLRLIGYDVEQLFVDPLLATSMSDFWGKRWNVAFSDMNRFVFVAAIKTALIEDLKISREAAGQIGVLAAFIASAGLHELGITVPVLEGFGGPSLYFVIQGICVFIEKRFEKTRDRFPIMSRLLMWIAIAAPFPICFVVPFRTEIALPLTLFVANLPTYFMDLFR